MENHQREEKTESKSLSRPRPVTWYVNDHAIRHPDVTLTCTCHDDVWWRHTGAVSRVEAPSQFIRNYREIFLRALTRGHRNSEKQFYQEKYFWTYHQPYPLFKSQEPQRWVSKSEDVNVIVSKSQNLEKCRKINGKQLQSQVLWIWTIIPNFYTKISNLSAQGDFPISSDALQPVDSPSIFWNFSELSERYF